MPQLLPFRVKFFDCSGRLTGFFESTVQRPISVNPRYYVFRHTSFCGEMRWEGS